MKHSLAVLFVLSIVCAAHGQTNVPATPCTLTKAPELHGLRLGMTISEVKARLPELIVPASDEFGFIGSANIQVSDLSVQSKESLRRISYVHFGFLDGRVINLRFEYRTNFSWKNVDEFLSIVINELKLPQSWVGDNTNKKLVCSDFEVRASASEDSASLGFYNPTTDSIIKKRQAEKRERLRREFKL